METRQTDPIIAEVREIRDRWAAALDYDVGAIFRKIQEMQDESGRDYVTYPVRRLAARADCAGAGLPTGCRRSSRQPR